MQQLLSWCVVPRALTRTRVTVPSPLQLANHPWGAAAAPMAPKSQVSYPSLHLPAGMPRGSRLHGGGHHRPSSGGDFEDATSPGRSHHHPPPSPEGDGLSRWQRMFGGHARAPAAAGSPARAVDSGVNSYLDGDERRRDSMDVRGGGVDGASALESKSSADDGNRAQPRRAKASRAVASPERTNKENFGRIGLIRSPGRDDAAGNPAPSDDVDAWLQGLRSRSTAVVEDALSRVPVSRRRPGAFSGAFDSAGGGVSSAGGAERAPRTYLSARDVFASAGLVDDTALLEGASGGQSYSTREGGGGGERRPGEPRERHPVRLSPAAAPRSPRRSRRAARERSEAAAERSSVSPPRRHARRDRHTSAAAAAPATESMEDFRRRFGSKAAAELQQAGLADDAAVPVFHLSEHPDMLRDVPSQQRHRRYADFGDVHRGAAEVAALFEEESAAPADSVAAGASDNDGQHGGTTTREWHDSPPQSPVSIDRASRQRRRHSPRDDSGLRVAAIPIRASNVQGSRHTSDDDSGSDMGATGHTATRRAWEEVEAEAAEIRRKVARERAQAKRVAADRAAGQQRRVELQLRSSDSDVGAAGEAQMPRRRGRADPASRMAARHAAVAARRERRIKARQEREVAEARRAAELAGALARLDRTEQRRAGDRRGRSAVRRAEPVNGGRPPARGGARMRSRSASRGRSKSRDASRARSASREPVISPGQARHRADLFQLPRDIDPLPETAVRAARGDAYALRPAGAALRRSTARAQPRAARVDESPESAASRAEQPGRHGRLRDSREAVSPRSDYGGRGRARGSRSRTPRGSLRASTSRSRSPPPTPDSRASPARRHSSRRRSLERSPVRTSSDADAVAELRAELVAVRADVDRAMIEARAKVRQRAERRRLRSCLRCWRAEARKRIVARERAVHLAQALAWRSRLKRSVFSELWRMARASQQAAKLIRERAEWRMKSRSLRALQAFAIEMRGQRAVAEAALARRRLAEAEGKADAMFRRRWISRCFLRWLAWSAAEKQAALLRAEHAARRAQIEAAMRAAEARAAASLEASQQAAQLVDREVRSGASAPAEHPGTADVQVGAEQRTPDRTSRDRPVEATAGDGAWPNKHSVGATDVSGARRRRGSAATHSSPPRTVQRTVLRAAPADPPEVAAMKARAEQRARRRAELQQRYSEQQRAKEEAAAAAERAEQEAEEEARRARIAERAAARKAEREAAAAQVEARRRLNTQFAVARAHSRAMVMRLYGWNPLVEAARLARLRVVKADTHCRTSLLSRVLDEWVLYAAAQRRAALDRERRGTRRAAAHFDRVLLWKTWGAWLRMHDDLLRREWRVSRRVGARRLGEAWRAWRRACEVARDARRAEYEQRVRVAATKGEGMRIRRAFEGWRSLLPVWRAEAEARARQERLWTNVEGWLKEADADI